MYGPARTWTDAIREFRGGKLLVLDPSKGVRDSLPAINDIRLPFANPPNPRENTRERRLLPVARFWSELTQSILWKTRGPFGPSDTIYPFLYLFSVILVVKYTVYYHDFVANSDAICYYYSGFGNPRAMENPFLLSFGVLWFRWHNYWAEEYIKMKNIQESDLEKYDEQIFNYARKWVVASHQVCPFNEVPVFLLWIKLIS